MYTFSILSCYILHRLHVGFCLISEIYISDLENIQPLQFLFLIFNDQQRHALYCCVYRKNIFSCLLIGILKTESFFLTFSSLFYKMKETTLVYHFCSDTLSVHSLCLNTYARNNMRGTVKNNVVHTCRSHKSINTSTRRCSSV